MRSELIRPMIGISVVPIAVAAGCSSIEDGASGEANADAARTEDASSLDRKREGPTALSCFGDDGSCWENTSVDGLAVVETLCAGAGVTVYSWSCAEALGVAGRAVALTCEDVERALRRTVYYSEDVEPGCDPGFAETAGNATTEIVSRCRAVLELLGSPPPPNCTSPGLRTHLERCVDLAAWLDEPCLDCVLAGARWLAGAGTDPGTGFVHCSELALGDLRAECADACG